MLSSIGIPLGTLSLFFGAAPTKVVVAYVPNWIEVGPLLSTVDWRKVTHVNVAFENPLDESGTMSFDPKDDLLVAKAHEKKLKVLISIGGGGAASDKTMLDRYGKLLSAENRAAFAAKLGDFVWQHGFDGLDVDLEGPAINSDYGPFVDELSKVMKAKGKLLTAAVSQGYGGDSVPSSVFDRFDLVNLMAYDGTGPWNPDRAGQHASMEMAKDNVAYWTKRGLPKSKAVLGVPFYGYGFGEAFRSDGYAYGEIVAKYAGAENMDQVGKTIWFNGIPTIRSKAKYVVDQGLAGVMIWSLDQDASGPRSLLAALFDELSKPARSGRQPGKK